MGCCGPSPTKNRVHPVKPQVGSDHDEDFDGPLKKRSCTDIICLILFIAFLGGMGYVAIASWSLGDPYRLLYGVDSWGNTCNRPNVKINNVSLSGRDMTGLSKLYYFNFLAVSNPFTKSNALCVKMCPNATLTFPADLQNFAYGTGSKLCRYDIPVANYRNGTTGSDVCPTLPVLPHQDLANRCTPDTVLQVGSGLLNAVSNVLNQIPSQCMDARTFFEKVASDVENTWKELLYLCAIALGVALVITFFMRFFACVVIWVLVIGTALGALAGTAFCWYSWYTLKKEQDNGANNGAKVQQWLIFACIASGVTVIILLILLVMRKRISLVVQLFREAGKALAKVPFLLIQPFWTFLILAAVMAGILFVFLYVETAGNPTVDPSTGHVSFVPEQSLFYLKWYYVLGILWLIQFIMACQQMVIAGSVASWYFTRDKSKLGWPIMSAIGRLIRYHLGSVAFGSLIIALIQLARLILAYIDNKLKGRAGPCVDFMLKCCQCCLWCFEKLMKFINWNAYIMIAIYGYNFCKGAQRAFSIIVSNVLRVGAINSVGTFCLFLGKVGVVAVVAVVGLEIWKNNTVICYSWVPIVLACIFAFFIAHTFLGIYGMIIDTIFMCFCEDCEKNDGVAKPYYMSYGLMEYVENSKEAIRLAKAREAQAKEEKTRPKTPQRKTLYPALPNKGSPNDVEW